MKQCFRCQQELRDDAQFCSKCGAKQYAPNYPESQDIPQNTPPTASPLRPALAIIGIIVVILAGVAFAEWAQKRNTVQRGAAIRATTQALIDSGQIDRTDPQPLDGFDASGATSYLVTGSAGIRVSLTYENASGNTEQIDDVAVPWRLNFTSEDGRFLYVAAQNKGESGNVKCTIMRGGKIISEASSSGAYVIAQCSESAR